MKQFSINPLLFIHTLVALLLLAACGPEETDIPAELPPAEITIVTGNNPTQVETELFRSFEDTYPGVKVKTENFGRNPRAYLESDTPPDVMIMWTGDWFLDPVRDGLAADLTDLWAQANLAESYPAGLRRLTELNGKQYFMPVGYQWRGIYYNREVFAENGLQPPQTWEEFLDACETLILNGVYPIALPRNAPWNTSLWFDYLDMRLNGAAFHRALIAGEESFTDERVRNVFLTWQMLFEKSYFLMDTSITSEMDGVSALFRGDRDFPLTREKAAMTLTDAFATSDFPQAFRDELEFFPFPTIDPDVQRGESVNAIGYIVPAKAPNPVQALAFLSYLTSSNARQLLTRQADAGINYAPALGVSDAADLPDRARMGLEIVQGADDIMLPIFWASPPQVRTQIESVLRRFFMGMEPEKEVDIDELLADLEAARLSAEAAGEYKNE